MNTYMTKKYPVLILLFLLNGYYGFCQRNPVTTIGSVTAVEVNQQKINIKTSNASAEITVYTPSIIRVRIDNKPFQPDFSYAVVGKVIAVKVQVSQTDNDITIVTDSLKAVISKKPFAVAFYTPDGRLINQDETGLTTSWAGDAVTTYKKMQDDEHFVGLGEKTGNLDRKGNGYTNWNEDNYGYSITQDPLYSDIPFYAGIHHGLNYGIFLDNTYQSDFNFGASNNRFSSFEARGGEMNYYFIYHKKLADIISSYTYLTGRMPMPPMWSLGYQQNRYSYYPEDEVLRIAHTLREKRIPADGITLDIHYMDRYQLFTWDKKRFTDPSKMTADLRKMGFRTTVIVDPGIKVEKGAAAYESGIKDSVYIKYPDGGFYTAEVWPGWCNFTDFTSVKGRNWWHNKVNFFAESGVSGIWNDMNEISTWGQKMPDNVLFDYDGRKASTLEAHNVYGMQMARSSYEGAREHFKERPFVLSRSGYAGLQRYAALWTGDNRAEDDHMLAGIRLLSSLGLSGVSFTGMDVGGFTGNPSIPLFTKWMELGCFIPYYRNHTANNTKAAEPWAFGVDALDVARNYINLRYQLLPYVYSTFYESTQNGLPVVRSLVINYTDDRKVLSADYQNQYEFGSAFLVAPFESTREYGKIYFPKGTWYDLYNGTVQQGNQEKVIPLSVNKLQVYVSGGSIIPMQSLIQSTNETPTDTLTIHVFNGDVAKSFTYYEDDGKSYAFQNGGFYKRLISFDPVNHAITFNKAEGSYATNFKNIKLVLHGFDQLSTIKYSGKQLKLDDQHFAFVGAGPGTDPSATSIAETCPVKTVVISNNSGSIKLNY
jgi:alpha-glucosidase